jgi:hypothetical protein
MSTYLFSWSDSYSTSIEKVVARSLNDCEEKIKNFFINKLDSDELDDLADYDVFITNLESYNYLVSPIYNVEEFL